MWDYPKNEIESPKIKSQYVNNWRIKKARS